MQTKHLPSARDAGSYTIKRTGALCSSKVLRKDTRYFLTDNILGEASGGQAKASNPTP